MGITHGYMERIVNAMMKRIAIPLLLQVELSILLNNWLHYYLSLCYTCIKYTCGHRYRVILGAAHSATIAVTRRKNKTSNMERFPV